MRKKVFYLGIIFLILHDTVTSAPREEKFKDMAAIPAGYFWMGVKDENEVKTAVEENKKLGYPLPAILFNREKPKHKVYLDAYYIDKYEVTNAEYKECVNAGKCKKPYDSKWYDSEKYGNHPVIWVDWHMADAYCKWAGKRLLTEAEWEKAARGENENIWPWGDVWDAQKCNNLDYKGALTSQMTDMYNGRGTVPIGSFTECVSPYGVYDMAGNVWEWVSDWSDDYYYKNSPKKNPKGPSNGTMKVFRGGGWSDADPYKFRGAYRDMYYPTSADMDGGVGIRCARTGN